MSLAGAGYAYWAVSVNNPDPTDKDYLITVGKGEAIDTMLKIDLTEENGILVPATRYEEDNGNVDKVVYTFEVDWKEIDGDFAKGHDGELTVTVHDIEIGKDDQFAEDEFDLVVITIKIGEQTSNTTLTTNIKLDTNTVTVVVTVTLNEPANRTEYLSIAEKDIRFSVLFSVDAE